MKYQVLFKQYVWLLNCINRYRRITLEEINRLWVRTEMSEGVEMARSTFNRHKDAIEDIFGIYIECDRKNGYGYYIGNAEVLRKDTIQNWMLSTMTVANLLSEHKSIHHRVLLENVPSSEEYLSLILQAMRYNRKVTFFYQKYTEEPGRERTLEPFCVKLYRRRWYVLGRINDEAFRIFSLDRMHDLEISDEKFQMPDDFDAESYFEDVVGVMTESDQPKQRIVIRAYGVESFYLQDLPLHDSQREIGRGEDYVDFEYTLVPTADFVRQLLSRGGMEKVLEPRWLSERLRQMAIYTAEMYDDSQKTAKKEKMRKK